MQSHLCTGSITMFVLVIYTLKHYWKIGAFAESDTSMKKVRES